VLSQA